MKSLSKQTLLWYFTAIAIGVLATSQLSSYLVNLHIPLGTTVELSGLIHFTHIRNLGGVFGMFQGQGWIFALFSFALILALVVYLLKSKSVQPYEYICFAFVVGGGSSNVLDRLIYGSVVDFIDIQHIPFWHYIFNVADMMIHIGLWPMLLFSLRDSRRLSTPVS
jgi:signal peptidase II